VIDEVEHGGVGLFGDHGQYRPRGATHALSVTKL
jgi:hypothetical protein